jgi:hypothetical protein
MMRIRAEHYQAYLDQTVGASRQRIMAALRQQLPEDSLRYTDGELGALCDRAMHRAAHYGMTTELNVYYFAGAMICCGEQFEDDPRRTWKVDFLDDPLMGQDLKGKFLALKVEVETGKGL